MRKRKCCKCKINKPLKEYYRSKHDKYGRKYICIVCHKAKVKRERPKHAKRLNMHLRKYRLKQYNLTLESYNKMLTKQNHVCKICKKPETTISPKTDKIRNLAVDHCHSSGIVRGLLCGNCNNALGFFYDNIQSLKEAIKYLRKAFQKAARIK